MLIICKLTVVYLSLFKKCRKRTEKKCSKNALKLSQMTSLCVYELDNFIHLKKKKKDLFYHHWLVFKITNSILFANVHKETYLIAKFK